MGEKAALPIIDSFKKCYILDKNFFCTKTELQNFFQNFELFVLFTWSAFYVGLRGGASPTQHPRKLETRQSNIDCTATPQKTLQKLESLLPHSSITHLKFGKSVSDSPKGVSSACGERRERKLFGESRNSSPLSPPPPPPNPLMKLLLLLLLPPLPTTDLPSSFRIALPPPRGKRFGFF